MLVLVLVPPAPLTAYLARHVQQLGCYTPGAVIVVRSDLAVQVSAQHQTGRLRCPGLLQQLHKCNRVCLAIVTTLWMLFCYSLPS